MQTVTKKYLKGFPRYSYKIVIDCHCFRDEEFYFYIIDFTLFVKYTVQPNYG